MAREAHEAAGAAGARGHRDHEPARDRGGLGPAHRRAAAPRDRLAGPAHGRALRRAPRGRPRAARSASAPGSCSTPTSPARRSSGCAARAGCRTGAVFGTIDSWLAYKLTGRHVTDYSNASRTLLFDIRCARLGPRAVRDPRRGSGGAARAAPSAACSARPASSAARCPVAGIAGDQQAALYGQACHSPGLGKNTYGTGSFVLQNAGPDAPPPADGLLTTVAWGVEGRVDYALEAAIFVTGAAVQWLRDALGVIDDRRRDRGARPLARGQRRRVPGARLHRARLAALGPLRARHDRGPHARHRHGSPRPRRARVDRPTRRWTPCGRWSPPSGVRLERAEGRRRRRGRTRG